MILQGRISPAGACLAGVLAFAPPQESPPQTLSDPGSLQTVAPKPLRIEVGAGYDFFSHSYSILSADTTSTLSEGNGTVNVMYVPQLERGDLELGNRFFMGDQYTHNVLSGYWSQGFDEGLTWAADGRWEHKRYMTDGLLFSNDHNAAQGSVRGTYRWADLWTIRGRLRGEVFDYARHSEFFYDTRSLSGAVAIRNGHWGSTWWELEISSGERTVPDSTVLDNTDRNSRFQLGWALADGGEITGSLLLNTRGYGESSPRPDRTWTGLEVRSRTAPFSTWGTWADLRLDHLTYSTQTLVYNDGTDLRVAGGPAWRPGMAWDVRLGAGYAFHKAKSFTDTTYVDLFGTTQLVDSYGQPFLFAETSVFGASGIWAFVTFELGQRDYSAQTDWDSDFLYVDLTVTAEIPLGRGLALQSLVNLAPERHRQPEDNSVTNYTSVDLVWRFR